MRGKNQGKIVLMCSVNFVKFRFFRPATYTEEKFKPFDWTFSSDYKGTLRGPGIITDTEERINIERLKEKEKILFYQELMLYEDELHDNGIASCTVKIVCPHLHLHLEI